MWSFVNGQQTSTAKETYLGHDDYALPRNVVLLKCLSENTFRLSVGVHIGRVKCVDAVVISANEPNRRKQRNQRSEGVPEDSRKLDVFQPLLLAHHPSLP